MLFLLQACSTAVGNLFVNIWLDSYFFFNVDLTIARVLIYLVQENFHYNFFPFQFKINY